MKSYRTIWFLVLIVVCVGGAGGCEIPRSQYVTWDEGERFSFCIVAPSDTRNELKGLIFRSDNTQLFESDSEGYETHNFFPENDPDREYTADMAVLQGPASEVNFQIEIKKWSQLESVPFKISVARDDFSEARSVELVVQKGELTVINLGTFGKAKPYSGEIRYMKEGDHASQSH